MPKHACRLAGFDDKVLAIYPWGLPTREIQYVSGRDLRHRGVAALISAVTDAVVEEVTAWQGRRLERLYPVVFFDALRMTISDEGV